MLKSTIPLSFALLLAACGGSGDGPPATSAQSSSPVAEATQEEAPAPDTVPLKQAKKGDLIALPFYPGVGTYGGTADVRGMKSLAVTMALAGNTRLFSPSVLIGSPGQEIRLTGFKAPSADIMGHHNFRISDTEAFSSDHELLADWKETKGAEFTFTFPEEGELAFYCSYHVRTNMAGMVIVRG